MGRLEFKHSDLKSCSQFAVAAVTISVMPVSNESDL
jgi:hypothetical protein